MTVIVAPPANARVERVNQLALGRVIVAANGLAQLGALVHDRGATGRDDGFEPMQAASAISTRLGFPHGVMPDVKAEKVEARWAVDRLKGVGDPRFTGLQGEAHRAEPLRDEVLAAFHDGAILMQDHEVIRVDDHIGWRPIAAATPWKRLGDGRLQTVKRDIVNNGRIFLKISN